MGCFWSRDDDDVTMHDPSLGPMMGAYTDKDQTECAFFIRLGERPMLIYRRGHVPMKLDAHESSMQVYTGQFKNKTWFKLLVPSTEGLTDKARRIGLVYIVSLYVGDKFEKKLRGNYFIFHPDTSDASDASFTSLP